MANQSELKVVITGDASSVMAALDQFKDKVTEASGKAKSGGQEAKGAWDEFTGGISKAAFGLGGFAELGAKAVDLVVEGLHKLAELPGEAIEETNRLTATYKQLEITAGMAVPEFNQFNAALELGGEKGEALTGIVQGMERGIKANSEVLVANGMAANQTALRHMTLAEYIDQAVKIMESYGDATDRDQFLMAAFDRGGMQVAEQLVELNKHMKEGEELGRAMGPITAQSVADLDKHREAVGRLSVAWEHFESVLAHAAMPIADGLAAVATKFLTFGQEENDALQLAQRGLIAYQGRLNATRMDIDAMVKEARAWHEEMDKQTKDAQAYSGGRELQRAQNAGPHFESKEDLEAKKKAQEEAARKAKEDARKAKEAAKEAEETGIQLQGELNRLHVEDLRTEEAITLQGKQQQADAVSAAKLHDAYAKIDQDLKKAPTKENTALAEKAKAAAYSTYIDEVEAHQREFDRQRTEGEQKLQGELISLGQKGLDARYAATKLHFDELRKLNEKLAQDGKSAVSVETINAAEQRARAQDLKEQTRADLEELKRQLAQATQIEGSLSRERQGEIMGQFAQEHGATGQQAVAQYQLEVNWNGTASQGALRGLKEFSSQTQNVFKEMSGFSKQFADTFSSQLGKAWSDAILHGGTMASMLTGLLRGLGQAEVQELMQVAARHVTNWGIEKTIALWKDINTKKEIGQQAAQTAAVTSAKTAQTTATTTAAASQTAVVTSALVAQTTAMGVAMAAALELAAAETWAAYAAIPFAGEALAAAQIGVMNGSMAAEEALSKGFIVAHAVGGIIDEPTLALMGEAGTELVAPETDFQQWATQLSGAHLNLGYNLAAHDAQLGRLQSQASAYARGAVSAAQASPASGSAGAPVRFDRCTFVGEGRAGMATAAKQINQLVQYYNQNYGGGS